MQLRFMTLFHTRKRLLSNDHIQMQLFILGNYQFVVSVHMLLFVLVAQY
jgi:hypothetical protein